MYGKKGQAQIDVYTDYTTVYHNNGKDTVNFRVKTPRWLAECIEWHRRQALNEYKHQLRQLIGVSDQ